MRRTATLLAVAGLTLAGCANPLTTEHTVVYKVTTNTRAHVAFLSLQGSSSIETAKAWTKSVTIKGLGGVSLTVNSIDISNQKAALSCEILIDGKSVVQQEGSGRGAIANCNATIS